MILVKYFLYPPGFDTITTIYQNCEYDLCVRLILNNLLALQLTIYTFLLHILWFSSKEISRLPISSLSLQSPLKDEVMQI